MNRRIVVCGGSKFDDYSLLESSLNKIFKKDPDDLSEMIYEKLISKVTT